MGYAQLDPLVVYKSEAYDKFQTLLYRLKFDITAYITSIDFSLFQPQASAQQFTAPRSQTEAEYIKILQQASQQVKNVPLVSSHPAAQPTTSEGIEVFEVNDTPSPAPSSPSGKVRPNDPCPCGSGKKYKKCCGAQ